MDGVDRDSAAGKWAEAFLRFLIAQDGSATLICETMIGGPVTLQVLHQQITQDVPAAVRAHLPGQDFIERQVCLSHDNQVMMDNLTYISLEQLDPAVRWHLEQGTAPIGYIFDTKQIRKKPVPVPEEILSALWRRSGTPDPDSVRTYLMEIETISSMLITENFRAGMHYGLPT
jgi:chorismate-pyruvate lyase